MPSPCAAQGQRPTTPHDTLVPVRDLGGGKQFYDQRQDVKHGAVAQRWYYSRTLGQMRRMHVWTPAGYEKSAESLPMLYLIHGGGDNDAS